MAANLPRLPVLLFIFLAVHVPSNHGDPPLPSTYDVSMCSESFGGVEIRYPFLSCQRNRSNRRSQRQLLLRLIRKKKKKKKKNSCGYTDSSISCKLEGQALIPTIRLGGDDYNNWTILPVDSDVFVGGSCPAVSHNVTFDETWLHNTSSNANLTFFFGCDLRDPVAHEFDAFKIICAGFKSPPDAARGDRDSFVLTSPGELVDRYLVQELATNCSVVVTVPVRGDVLMAAISNQSNFTSGRYGDVIKRGFELEWSRITGAADGCHLREESYGQCSYSQHREFLGCLCHGGKVGNPYCKHIVPASTATASNGEQFLDDLECYFESDQQGQ